MTDQSANIRLAKNTILLYGRMIILMLISLYTSRVILNALGVVDYGIYNVVGGVVAMFSMISASLSSAITRFMTYELGKNNSVKLPIVFSTSVNIQIILVLIIICIAETIGLWFLNYHLVIPENRIDAANWCYQFSLITFSINLISVPYNASIIAHEKMSAFAYISIIEAIGQLIIAFLIQQNPFDRLILYGLLLCLLAILVRFIYTIYCNRQFKECHFSLLIDKRLIKQMLFFAGWNMYGTCSAVLRTQGNNILLNMFFGPAVNGAQAIATKVNAVVANFVQKFIVAINPQITKSYAVGDKENMFNLVFQGGRFSFYLILLLSMPIILNTNYILVIWLKLVPEYTVIFIQLILILEMCESLSHTMVTAILAEGNIKKYMLIVGSLQMLNVPINLLLLIFGSEPYMIYIIAITISQICLLFRLVVLHKQMGLNLKKYIKQVYLNVIKVSLLSMISPYLFSLYFSNTFFSFIMVSLVSILSVGIVEYYIGCSFKEREYLKMKLLLLIHKRNG